MFGVVEWKSRKSKIKFLSLRENEVVQQKTGKKLPQMPQPHVDYIFNIILGLHNQLL